MAPGRPAAGRSAPAARHAPVFCAGQPGFCRNGKLPFLFFCKTGFPRAYAAECEPYTGKFEDASECTLRIEAIAMKTILDSMNAVGVKTPCGDSILDLFNKGIESGSGAKNVAAIVNELV